VLRQRARLSKIGVGRLTYRVREAAQLLGVSPDSIYDAVNRGEIRYLRFGRTIRIPKFVVDEMVGRSAEAALT